MDTKVPGEGKLENAGAMPNYRFPTCGLVQMAILNAVDNSFTGHRDLPNRSNYSAAVNFSFWHSAEVLTGFAGSPLLTR